MDDVMAALRDRRAKAEGRVARAAKALESAKNELSDVLAAERVMAEITGEATQTKVGAPAHSDRDQEMVRLLNSEQSNAISPADLHPTYVEVTGDNLNLEAFRTAIWRLQKKVVWEAGQNWSVKSDQGRYWREAVSGPTEYINELLG